MDLDEFRREAHALADWAADYLRDVGRERVMSAVEPGQLRGALPASPPRAGEPFGRIREDFDRIVYPGLTHWAHPGFFGYFPANHSPPSILAEFLVAALGTQGMSWQTSPAATELEQVVMDWLRQMVGLPDGFVGVIQDYASTSTLVALITARDRHRDELDRATVYLSAEAHSSVAKGARLAGYRPELIRPVPTDATYAMDPGELARMVAADRGAGLRPSAVVATLGTTSSTGFDPVPAIGAIARTEGLWLHVDAAFAGSAAIVPELRWIMAGIEQADSVVLNPHKWLLVNHDCSAYFVRDPGALLRSFSTSPEYLKTKYDASVINYRDWGIPLGRRFRALKLWFVIRSYGVDGLVAMIREHVRLGHRFAGWVEADERFELAAPAPVGLVCFRLRGRPGESGDSADDANRRLLERINAPGDFLLTHTVLGGRFTLRLALGHLSTTEALVARLWARTQEAATAPGR
ncbi:MAG: pyridoxal-dependent decarboxylase [Gemmatimonadales bacterium]